MAHLHTLQETAFLEYFRAIGRTAIDRILAQSRSTGPSGYATSLVLARILKVKERISSDRELSEKLAKIKIYREAIGITRNRIPAHNTFHTLRQRLGPDGFARIHQHLVLRAFKAGPLTPPIPNLPKMVRGKIILLGDSTFLKAVASTRGVKDEQGNWLFTDDSIAFGKSHHKHKYALGHRSHTLTAVSGIPLVSLLAPANENDQLWILPLLDALRCAPTASELGEPAEQPESALWLLQHRYRSEMAWVADSTVCEELKDTVANCPQIQVTCETPTH